MSALIFLPQNICFRCWLAFFEHFVPSLFLLSQKCTHLCCAEHLHLLQHLSLLSVTPIILPLANTSRDITDFRVLLGPHCSVNQPMLTGTKPISAMVPSGRSLVIINRQDHYLAQWASYGVSPPNTLHSSPIVYVCRHIYASACRQCSQAELCCIGCCACKQGNHHDFAATLQSMKVQAGVYFCC